VPFLNIELLLKKIPNKWRGSTSMKREPAGFIVFVKANVTPCKRKTTSIVAGLYYLQLLFESYLVTLLFLFPPNSFVQGVMRD
jgi:hypothetical protein